MRRILSKKKLVFYLVLLVLLISSLVNNLFSFSLEFYDKNKISDWAKYDVSIAVQKGFVEGDDEGNFRPKDNITRAEFTKIILGILDIKEDKDIKSNFNDVRKKDWFYSYVVTANKLGIVNGYGKEFNPNATITRQEMATMIVRGLNKKGIDLKVTSNDYYKDQNSIGSWALDSVKKVSANGIMTGYDKIFDPQGKATREMATVSVMRSYKILSGGIIEKPKPKPLNVRPIIEKTGKKMYTEIDNPDYGTIAGEWSILGLSRGNIKVPFGYYDKYYNNIEKEVKKRMDKNGYLDRNKKTEESRLILALTSINKDVTNVGGYNLLESLTDMNMVTKQGINGPVFALIAFDSNNYQIPTSKNIENQVTRDKLIDFILNREIKNKGGWELGPNPKNPDPDITAMVLQSLAPYYNKRKDVKLAVDRGVEVLSKIQNKDGGYLSWGSLNSESAAQVVTALTALDIDPHNDPRFIKNGNSVLDNLLSFKGPKDGFYHIKPGNEGNGGAIPGIEDPMATDQAMYALVAYDRFVNNQNRLYDMTDVK